SDGARLPSPAVRRLALLAALALIGTSCSGPGGSTTSSPAPTGSTTTLPAASTSSPTTTAAATTSTGPATTSTIAPVPLTDIDLSLTEVASGLTAPVFITAPPGDDRLFVVEQDGHILLLRDGEIIGTFLDLSDLVAYGGEQGLLGLAFHPGYPNDGRFYVDYTDRAGDTAVVEYRVSADPDAADPGSERVLLTVDQPAANHNGGMIAFGPDGYLYVGLGDGGGAGDPQAAGQDPEALLGSILRIDVAGEPYAIPPDNPYAAGGGAPEVWAKGLRNPWRFSFDGELIYIGDVGQGAWEEINVAPIGSPGLNFGWSVTEGSHCYRADGCDTGPFHLPDLEYGHTGGNCSVTGGYVYRGRAIPELAGAYFYGDYCSGMVASFRRDLEGIYETRVWSDSLGPAPGLTSFGVDGAGELYLTTADGLLYRIDRG
ncbi:MAG TPA: PQQ-dependent sugar dehydrogenase, partial [Acidimicrobiia bacterium]|nr:PQQ-dependent sugar dehydrogenase [Acidimicrobiia bacterium]